MIYFSSVNKQGLWINERIAEKLYISNQVAWIGLKIDTEGQYSQLGSQLESLNFQVTCMVLKLHYSPAFGLTCTNFLF